MSKYSDSFKRDFSWYLSVRHIFNFDGNHSYFNKKGENIIQFDKNGVDGKKAFFDYDSSGRITKTKHPNLLHVLLKTKGSVNLHIKMYAEDRAKGVLPKILFEEICKEYNTPTWFAEAVEKQKFKYYNLYNSPTKDNTLLTFYQWLEQFKKK